MKTSPRIIREEAPTPLGALASAAAVLDQLDVGMAVFDDEHRCLLWNASFLRLFPEHVGHVRVGEHYSENLRRFYRTRLSDAELDHIERYVADGVARHRDQAWPFEFSHRGRWLRAASLPVEGGGRIRTWAPIAAPENADARIAQVKHGGRDALIASIDHFADGLMIRNEEGCILAVNRRFCDLYGLLSEADPVGQTFDQVLARAWGAEPAARQAAIALADSSRFSGAPYTVPLPADRRVRISERSGLTGSRVSIHVDITAQHRLQVTTAEAQARAEALAASLKAGMEERQRTAAALEQAKRAEVIGQLTAGVAHDFNNLLSTMLTNLEILSVLQNEAAAQDKLSILRATVQRGATLTRQLLATARRQPLLPRPVSLRRLFRETLPLLQAACGSAVRIRLELADDLPAVLADPGELELVILNLAINARDAMPDGGELLVAARPERAEEGQDPEAPVAGDYVTLTVVDTGHGMVEEVRRRATEPFFTTKGPGRGSGLGLSQAYGFARQLGGTLRIESAPGQGTSVHLVLPVADEFPAGQGGTIREPASPDQIRLLLVDDEELVLNGLAEMLKMIGYGVTAVTDPLAASDALRAEPGFDLLITDVRMPVMSGPELAIEAWGKRPDLPVLFLTGYAPPETLAELRGSYRMLLKPYRTKDVQGAIEALLTMPLASGASP